MEIVSPTAENSYRGFGDNPTQLRRLAWQGIVGVDLLQKLLWEHRPYELNEGETGRVYRECLDLLVRAIEEGGGRKGVEAMEAAAEKFRALPVDRSERKPIVGMVGEIYLRANAFTNQQIIRKVEALGGEVWVASMMEWMYYTNWSIKWGEGSLREKHYLWEFLKVSVVDWVQRRDEHRMVEPIEDLLLYAHETPVGEIMDNDRPYFDPILGTEAVLTIGKAVDFAKLGVSGIINIMPFTCMPGIITAGVANRIREDNDNIPWLDVIYDAQGETNLTTRLEAFMYQARQYRRRMNLQILQNLQHRQNRHMAHK
jgi:predicted nucleotide-binding protein (sugar kinase/HSP70/actin superfamily)